MGRPAEFPEPYAAAWHYLTSGQEVFELYSVHRKIRKIDATSAQLFRRLADSDFSGFRRDRVYFNSLFENAVKCESVVAAEIAACLNICRIFISNDPRQPLGSDRSAIARGKALKMESVSRHGRSGDCRPAVASQHSQRDIQAYVQPTNMNVPHAARLEKPSVADGRRLRRRWPRCFRPAGYPAGEHL